MSPNVIGDMIICNECGAGCTKEAGYFECHECKWRFYGDPNTEAYNDGCENCGTVHLKCLRWCPCCGLLAND